MIDSDRKALMDALVGKIDNEEVRETIERMCSEDLEAIVPVVEAIVECEKEEAVKVACLRLSQFYDKNNPVDEFS